MDSKSTCGGLDVFRLAAALLVIAIHTSPLASFCPEADFLLTRVAARLAVPFFFMVTGQFLLSDYIFGKTNNLRPVYHHIRKILLLYAISVLLYIPAGIYAGHYEQLTLSSGLRMLLFDGTFYHLWYFPALITGILLLCLLRRFCSVRTCAAVTAGLYLAGLFGDSYWGLISGIPCLSAVYEAGFHIYTYTRNGIFLAPLFLFLGAWTGQKNYTSHLFRRGHRENRTEIFGFVLSLLLMAAEALTLKHFSVQRHDSMYVMLPLCACFLYRLLLSWDVGPYRALRSITTWIYILHPAVIILVRGAARLLRMETLLVQNSLIHYTAVCILSIALSCPFAAVCKRCRRKSFLPDRAQSFSQDRAQSFSQDRTQSFSRNRVQSFSQDRAWIELDRNALCHNVSVLSSALLEHCELMPAVKANAYGHGAVLIAGELNRAGIRAFCVACISEGIELRKNGIKGTILILGYTHPEQFPLLCRYRLTQTVVDYAYAQKLNQYGKKLHVHVAIDTGMHRLGESSHPIDRLCEIFQMKHLIIDGAFTHLCAADTDDPKDQTFTRRQAHDFYRAMDELKKRGISCPKVHLLSSCGILNYPELSGDYARVGIALYGVQSSREDYRKLDIRLQPVLTLKARIATVKVLMPGEGAGYGLAFTAEKPTRIAILTIGYADGLPRALSCGAGSVLIHGRRAPIIGRICMDQTTVDISDIPDVHPGDTAVIIGTSGGETISVYELAEKTDTITNEILSRLGSRLNRSFDKKNDSPVHSESSPHCLADSF